MAVDTERRAKKSASRLDHSLLLQPVITTMSYNPPTHSPDHLADSNSFQTPADHAHSKPILPGQDLTTHQLASKKRRSSKSKNVGELRRSTSTPHMRNVTLANAGDLSPTSNKPRNKLGYHRTSVACGHCRRRKIRCLLASEDPQGRCANCIRLKKECNFFPVEHNPDGSSTQSKDTSPVQPLTPAASSPQHSQSGEKVVDFRAPMQAVAPNASFSFHTESEIDPRQGTNSGRMPVQQPPFPYPHPIDTQWPPAAAFLPSSTVAESPQSSTGYWRQSPSTATSVYGSESNVSGGHTPAAMSTSSTMSYGHPENQPWGQQPPFQPPTRSMSYGNIEGLSQPYSGQGLGIQHHDFPRRTAPFPYPPSIDTNPATMHATTIGGPTTAPLSAPVVPNQYFPQAWNMYDGLQAQGGPMQIPGRAMSVQWYSDPGRLDRVQEEGPPPAAYNQHGMQQYYTGS